MALLRQNGYRAVTMEAVAAQAGVGKATVYRWWPNKASLIVDAVSQQMAPPVRASGDTETDVRRVVDSILTTVRDLLGDILIADVARDTSAATALAALLGPYRAANAAALLGAAGRGDLPYDLDHTTVLDMIAGTLLYRRLMGRPVTEALADQLATLILTGQLPRTS